MHSPTQFDRTNLEYKPDLESNLPLGILPPLYLNIFVRTTITNRGLGINIFTKSLRHRNKYPQLLTWISYEFHEHPI